MGVSAVVVLVFVFVFVFVAGGGMLDVFIVPIPTSVVVGAVVVSSITAEQAICFFVCRII